MTMEIIVGVIIGMLLGGFFFVCGLGIGANANESELEDMREEAVELGKAEYYLDENNERQWRWKK